MANRSKQNPTAKANPQDPNKINRRSFITASGAGIAASAVGSALMAKKASAGAGQAESASQGFDQTAIGPFDKYCDGYGRPGAKGLGYVCVLKVSTGVVKKNDDTLVDGIVAYDRAEANDAYIGQINMETASSFCGLTGNVWGYDLARAGGIGGKGEKPMFTLKQYDGTPLPVFNGGPLLMAGQALFGVEQKRRFPPAPGSHVICANKSLTRSRPKKGKPDPNKGEAYGVWCYVAVSIAKDRNTQADLFIEDAGAWTKGTDRKKLVSFLDDHQKIVAWSIAACGEDQSVVYHRTYMSYAYVIMEPGYIGTALTAVPYVVLARKAVPGGDFEALKKMGLEQWEKAVGL